MRKKTIASEPAEQYLRRLLEQEKSRNISSPLANWVAITHNPKKSIRRVGRVQKAVLEDGTLKITFKIHASTTTGCRKWTEKGTEVVKISLFQLTALPSKNEIHFRGIRNDEPWVSLMPARVFPINPEQSAHQQLIDFHHEIWPAL